MPQKVKEPAAVAVALVVSDQSDVVVEVVVADPAAADMDVAPAEAPPAQVWAPLL